MKKIILLAVVFLAGLSMSAHAAVTDAPHNDNHGVACNSCHSYSMWWELSPVNVSSESEKADIVNTICMGCHDANDTVPMAKGHSGMYLSTDHHGGNWGASCSTCHNPHHQAQLDWRGTENPELYLRTGTIDSIEEILGSPNTLVTVSGVSENLDWPAVGASDLDNDWTKKNGNASKDRSLIFVHDTGLASNTFSIVSVTETGTTIQLEIKGHLDPAEMLTATNGSATANTFGLIYGQLVRETVATTFSGDMPVKFFDPNGGFVDMTNYDGICQVCHTETLHYRNNTDPNDPNPTNGASHASRDDSNCVTCHEHAEAFKGSGHEDSDFEWALIDSKNCTDCHSDGGSGIVGGIHGGTCGICHVLAGGGGPLKEGDSTDGIDGTAIGANTNPFASSTCADCHGTASVNTIPDAHHLATPGNYAVNGVCTQCHDNAIGKRAANHAAAIVDTNSTCSNTGCHTATAGLSTGAPVSSADNKIHDACTICHQTDGNLRAASDTTIDSALVDAMPLVGGECTDCHTYTGAHSINHSTKVILPDNCAKCHGTTVDYNNFVDVDPNANDNAMVHDACATCHDVTDYSLRTDLGRTLSAGKCDACHFTDFTEVDANNIAKHKIVDHSTMVAADTACTNCHDATAASSTELPLDDGTSVAANKVHDNCATCHMSNGNLIDPAGSDLVDAMTTTGNCQSCHTYVGGHIDHAATGRVILAPSNNCDACHTVTISNTTFVDPANNSVHDNCDICHVDRANDNYALRLADSDGRTLVKGNCIGCHTEKEDGAGNAKLFTHVVDHVATDRVTLAGNCMDCHAATVAGNFTSTGDAKKHDACTTCHVSETDLDLVTITDRTIAKGDCTGCHFTDFAAAPHKVVGHSSMVAVDTVCTGCHNATAGSGTGIPVAEASDKVHDDCAACHTASGRLVDFSNLPTVDAMPIGTGGNGGNDGGGNCQACHTYTGQHIDHAATSRVTLPTSGTCGDCHDATVAFATFTNTDNNAIHDSCDTCHIDEANNNYGLRVADSDGRTLVAGDCTKCHSDKDDGAGTVNLFSHVIDHAANELVTLASNCMDCHSTTVTAPFTKNDDVKKHDACTVCHLSASDLSLVTIANRTIAKGDCTGCHFADFAAAPHKVVGHANMVAAVDATCNVCHDATAGTATGIPVNSGTDQAANKVHDGCADCHTANGRMVDFSSLPLIKDMPNGGTNGGVDGGGDCKVCHTYTGAHTDHRIGDKVILPTTGTLCGTCHDATVNPDTFTSITNDLVHDACTTCHVDPDGGNYALWKATDVAGPGRDLAPGTCISCHPDKTNLFLHKIDHVDSGLVTLQTATNCVDCHVATVEDPFINPAANDKKHNSCGVCHVSYQDLSMRTIPNRTIARGDCYVCHFDDFAAEPHAVIGHANTVRDDAACNSCHTATYGTSTGIPVSTTDGKVHNSCATCHTADGGLVAPNGSVDAMPAGGGTCRDCHIYEGDHIDHATKIGVPALCGTCHDATINAAPFANGNNDMAHDQCTTCHTDTATNGYNIPGFTPGTDTCFFCHNDFDNNLFSHDIDHAETDRVDLIPACENCHADADDYPDFVGTSDTQHDACDTCHTSNTNLTLVANAAAGAGGNANCNTCHYDTFAEHAQVDHLNRVMPHSNCTSCHDSTAGTSTEIPINPDVGTVHDSCLTCHEADGSLLGGSQVALCYLNADGTYLEAEDFFQQVADPGTQNHQFSVVTGDITANNGSYVTTTSGATGYSPVGHRIDIGPIEFPSGTATYYVWMRMRSENSSGNSAYFGVDGNMVGALWQTASTSNWYWTNTIQTGTGTNVVSVDGGSRIINIWTREATQVDGIYFTTIPGVPAGLTGGIHQYNGMLPTGAVVLDPNNCGGGSSTIAPGDCTDCHFDTFAGHDDVGHDNFVTPTSNCVTCHDATAGTSTGIPTGNSNKDHNACTSCHASSNGVLINEAAGGRDDCAGCHGFTSFGSSHVEVGHNVFVNGISNCTGCHIGTAGTTTGIPTNGGDIMVHDGCTQCHEADGSMKPLASAGDDGVADCGQCHFPAFGSHKVVGHSTSVEGNANCVYCHDATAGTPTSIPTNVQDSMIHDACTDCHNDAGVLISYAAGNYDPNKCNDCHGATSAAAHHGGATAKAGNCQVCHADPRPWADAPTQAGCRECHIDNNGYVDISNGFTANPPSHAWNTNGAIQDFGACFACHVPTPYHGKPASAAFQDVILGKGTLNLFYNEFRKPEKYYENTPDEDWYKRNVRRTYEDLYGQPTVVFHWATFTLSADTYSVPHFDGQDVTMTTPSHNRIQVAQGCSDCHTVTNIITSTHNNDCQACHFSDRPEVQIAVTDGIGGANVDCADCHNTVNGGHDPVNDHNMVSVATGCSNTNCHGNAQDWNDIEALHDNDPQDSVDQCLTCHNSTRTDVENAIIAGKSGTGVDCTTCHGAGSASAAHHSGTDARNGNCTICHTVPTWAQDTPEQAACRQCHINSSGYVIRLTGSGGVVHAMNTDGAIQDFGACIACHNSGGLAPAVAPYHPKPTSRPDYHDSAPGKGSFNIFWSDFHRSGGENNQGPGCGEGSNCSNSTYRNAEIDFEWANVSHDGSSATVPYFLSSGSGGGSHIDSISPNDGRRGDVISLYGTISSGSTERVYVGTRSASIYSWSTTRVRFYVPDMNSGYYDVKVTVDGVGSNTIQFRVRSY